MEAKLALRQHEHPPSSSLSLEKLYEDADTYIKYQVGRGRSTFSSKYFKKGDTVLEEEPSLSVLNVEKLNTNCSTCFLPVDRPTEGKVQPNQKINRCSQCKLTVYCNRECQLKGWALGHKLECKLWKEKGFQPNQLVQICLRALSFKTFQHSTPLQLTNNYDPKDSERVLPLAHTVKEVLKYYEEKDQPSLNAILQVLTTVQVNALQTFDVYLVPLSTSVYKRVSLVNHSCKPNCTVTFNNRKVIFTANRDILNDTELTVGYIDTTQPLTLRTQQLYQQYQFQCTCERCQLEQKENPNEVDLCKKCVQKVELSLQTKKEDLICSLCGDDDSLHYLPLLNKLTNLLELGTSNLNQVSYHQLDTNFKLLQELQIPQPHYFWLKVKLLYCEVHMYNLNQSLNHLFNLPNTSSQQLELEISKVIKQYLQFDTLIQNYIKQINSTNLDIDPLTFPVICIFKCQKVYCVTQLFNFCFDSNGTINLESKSWLVDILPNLVLEANLCLKLSHSDELRNLNRLHSLVEEADQSLQSYLLYLNMKKF